MQFVLPKHSLYHLLNDDDVVLNVTGVVWFRGATVIQWLGAKPRLLTDKTFLREAKYKAPLGDILLMPTGWKNTADHNKFISPFLSINGIMLLLNETRDTFELAAWLMDVVLPAAKAAFLRNIALQVSKVVRDLVPQVRILLQWLFMVINDTSALFLSW